jgi:hypothetical protein
MRTGVCNESKRRFDMPTSFFRIDMLPASHGDCLWVEYGTDGRANRILIDGGPLNTYEFIAQRVDEMPPGNKVIELVVLTHVDADHIEGLVRLFADKPLPFVVNKVWFNGWRQMKETHGLLGALQGEFLSALLVHRVPDAWGPGSKPWVVLSEGELTCYNDLPDGMKITLLSPDVESLDKMAKAWEKEKGITREGIKPGDLEAAWKALAKKKKFIPKEGLLGGSSHLDDLLKAPFMKDDTVPNGSSIAFLAEFAGKSVLFLADAHPDVVSESLRRICAKKGVARLAVDAVKVAHHGSKKNTSRDMLELISSPVYLISTNGDKYGHPDPECMALILKYGKPKKLYFNYASDYTKPWLSKESQKKYGYKAVVPASEGELLRVEL